MDIVLWIAAGLAAAAFLAAGSLKISKSREALQAQGLAWVEDFEDAHVKTIGSLEVLGAIGLILPAAINVVPILVPIAAVGLAITMVGAIITHVRRRDEPVMVAPSVILLVLVVFVAWGRFGPYAF